MKSKSKSNTRSHFLYSVIYRLSIIILPLFITPYIARVLGSDNNGLYAFSSTIACYFIMFGKLGMDHYASRAIAVIRDDRVARSRAFIGIYIIQFVASVLSMGLYWLLVLAAFPSQGLLYRLQFIYVLSVLFDVSWFFYGMEKFKFTTIRSLISRGLLIAAVFAFVKTESDLPVFTLLMSLSFLIEQIMLIPFVLKHIQPVKVSAADVAAHIKPSLKLFVPILALSVYHWTDKIMLGLMKGNDPVAYYNYAESIINLPKGIIIALGTVMLPKISRMAADRQIEDVKRALRLSMKLIAFLSCALSFGIAGMAPVFVPYFLGDMYRPTILLTIQLAVVMIPMSITDVLQTQYLIPFKRDGIYIRSILIGALTNVVLNFFMITPFGASGAVISTLIAEIGVMVYQVLYVRQILPIRSLISTFAPFFVCGLIEFAIVFAIGTLDIAPLPLIAMQVGSGAAAFLLCYGFYIMVFKRKEGGLRAVFRDGAIRLP